ncbi:MAG TPA: ABC transporter ATP-binding protein [Candidatus Binatia bacterium]|nr:ABC transporter ATP-binding protein [Candidatus Binatia bacterium]
MGSLRHLLPYLRRHKIAIFFGTLSIGLTTVFQVWSPWLVRQAVDHLQAGVSRAALLRDSGLILLAVTLQGVFLFTMRMSLIRASRRMEYELRNDLFDHFARLPAETYRTRKVGDLLSRATNDLDAVRNFLGPGIMYFGNTIATFVLAVTLMCRIDLRLTLLSLIPLPILSFTVARLGAQLHHHYEAIQASFATMTAKAQETLAGIRVVKAHVEEEGEYRAFAAIHEDYLEKNRAMIKIWSGMWPMLSLLGGIASAIVLGVGGAAVVRGQITLGELVAFQIYLAMLIWPMISLGWVSNLFQRGAASMGRIQEILALPAEEDVEPGMPWPCPDQAAPDGASHAHVPAVALENVSFHYPGTDRNVLHALNLSIRAGETLAVVGRTGSGKTTLLNLIARLYEPTGGMIRFEGHPVAELPRGPLRRRLGIVPQETFLFSDTIRANVAFGFEPGAPQPDVDEVVRRAGLSSDLTQFPQGLDTMIGERGITLSGGQKQRVALARALALERPVLLLDDAFASVDPGTEEEILDNLFRATQRATVVLATHRRSALLRVDRIVVLDEGAIVASGTHEELLARGGLYGDLYHLEEVVEELEAL